VAAVPGLLRRRPVSGRAGAVEEHVLQPEESPAARSDVARAPRDKAAQRDQPGLADGLSLPAARAPREDDHVVRLRRQRAHVRGADVRQAEALLREGLGGAGAQR